MTLQTLVTFQTFQNAQNVTTAPGSPGQGVAVILLPRPTSEHSSMSPNRPKQGYVLKGDDKEEMLSLPSTSIVGGRKALRIRQQPYPGHEHRATLLGNVVQAATSVVRSTGARVDGTLLPQPSSGHSSMSPLLAHTGIHF